MTRPHEGDAPLASSDEEASRLQALLREEREARDSAIAEAVRTALDKERAEREEALAAQEHRATVATVNLVAAMVRREWSKVPGRAGAFVFAALMRPGTAIAVSLVALATLALTAVQVVLLSRQNELLEAQNARVDIQTAVAEAGRRADLAREARAVIAEMIAERERTLATSPRPPGRLAAGEAPHAWGHLECIPSENAEAVPELCWRVFRRWPDDVVVRYGEMSLSNTLNSREGRWPREAVTGWQTVPPRCVPPGRGASWPSYRGCPLPDPPSWQAAEGGGHILRSREHLHDAPSVWYPSANLALRLASLTKGLGPHRPVVVEEGDTDCALAAVPSLTLHHLLGWDPVNLVATRSGNPNTGRESEETARRRWTEIASTLLTGGDSRTPGPAQGFPWSQIDRVAARLAPPRGSAPDSVAPRVRFACAPASAERGEILLELLDAGLHPDAVGGRGGDFSGALLQGASLINRLLEGIDLSAARFAEKPYSFRNDRQVNSMRNVLVHHVALDGADLRAVRMHQVFALTPQDWHGAMLGLRSFDLWIQAPIADLLAGPQAVPLTLVGTLPQAAWQPLAGLCDGALEDAVGGEPRRLRAPWRGPRYVLVLREGPPIVADPTRPFRVEMILHREPMGSLPDTSMRLVDLHMPGRRLVIDQLRISDCLAPESLPVALLQPVAPAPGPSPAGPAPGPTAGPRRGDANR